MGLYTGSPIWGAALIRGFVVEAVAQFGIGGDDEAVVGERATRHILQLPDASIWFGSRQ